MRGLVRVQSLVAIGILFGMVVPQAHAGTLSVVTVAPGAASMAAPGSNITVRFDRAVAPASISAASFRVFGRWSGTAAGRLDLGSGNMSVSFTPDVPFSSGETVRVNLAETIVAADGSPFRRGGFAWEFTAASAPSELDFEELGELSNTTGEKTTIYGASAADLNEDGFLDLTTINEDSADIRVFLSLGDGTGDFGAFLAPQGVGLEASPNETADFDNDGHSDLCLSASDSDNVWILLGRGDGTFGPITSIPVGAEPHGIATLDVDGDGDMDIVNANRGSDNLTLLLNDGTGGFGAAVPFDGGVAGEYGLAAGDMDGDGLVDLVVAGNTSQTIRTLRSNGNGGFAAAAQPQQSGGPTWVVVLGDVDGDGDLDAATANSYGNNAAVLLGNGDGTFAPPKLTALGSQATSTDLGDLDGDGDLDWVLSSYGAGFWRLYANDGSGTFAMLQQINAPANASCALLFDMDNDRDLDLGLTDEGADVIVLMENRTAWADVGHALGGLHGAPFCTGKGVLAAGTPLTLTLSNAKENAATWLIAGVTAPFQPLKGGILVPDPGVAVALNSGPEGALSIPGLWPAGVPAGTTIYVQCWVSDPSGPEGFAASNGLQATTP